MDEEIKRSRGRPTIENKKRHPPRITLYPETIDKMQEIAELSDRSLTDIYQDALDLYISRNEIRKNVISL